MQGSAAFVYGWVMFADRFSFHSFHHFRPSSTDMIAIAPRPSPVAANGVYIIASR